MDAVSEPRSARLDIASGGRERLARTYLLAIRPLLLSFATVITLLDVVIKPDSIQASLWVPIGSFWLVELGVVVALRLGVAVTRVLPVTFTIDTFLWLAVLPFVADPNGAASSIVVLVVLFAYFQTPAQTMVFSVAVAAVITIMGPRLEHWTDPAPLPASAFTVLVTGALIALVTRQLRRTERAYEQVVESQHKALVHLEQVDRSRDRMIASVSHELRTPLTSTLGFIETLLREDVSFTEEEKREMLLRAHDGGTRLLSLVEDLLTIGSSRPDAMVLDMQPAVVRDLVADAVAGIVVPVNRELDVDMDGWLDSTVIVDRHRMLQVITNLVINAIYHGRGTIAVRCDVDFDGVRIRVLDEGDGIPPEHLDELFQPFSTFSSRPDSTGLGLAISRAIVEAHSGTLTYCRTPEDLTCFSVELPVDEATPA